MGNGTVAQMKVMVRMGCVICEIPLFSPWNSHVSQGATDGSFLYRSAAQSRGQLGKVEVGIRETGNENALGDGGIAIWASVEMGSGEWELENGRWKWGHAT